MKKCKTCGETKSLEKFPKRSALCKLCRNQKNREKYDPEKERIRSKKKKEKNYEKIKELNKLACLRYREKNLNRIRKKGRERYHRKKQEGNLPKKYESKKAVKSVQKWQKNNKHKVKASYLVRKALWRGELKKPDFCPFCGEKDVRIEAHHEDYTKPLEVLWCCRRCHGKFDRIRRAEEQMTNPKQD